MLAERLNGANVTTSAYDQKGITSTADTYHSAGFCPNSRGSGILKKWSNSEDVSFLTCSPEVISADVSTSASVPKDPKGITSTTDTDSSVGIHPNTRGSEMLTKWPNTDDVSASACPKGISSTTHIDRSRGIYPVTRTSANQGFILGHRDASEDGTMSSCRLGTLWGRLSHPDDLEREEVDQHNSMRCSALRLPCFPTVTSTADTMLSNLIMIDESEDDGGFTPCISSNLYFDPLFAPGEVDGSSVNSRAPSSTLPTYHSASLTSSRQHVPKFRERARPAETGLQLVELGPTVDELDFNPCTGYRPPSPTKVDLITPMELTGRKQQGLHIDEYSIFSAIRKSAPQGTWYKTILRSKAAALLASRSPSCSRNPSPAQGRGGTAASREGLMSTGEETPALESGRRPDNAKQHARLEQGSLMRTHPFPGRQLPTVETSQHTGQEVHAASVKPEVHEASVKQSAGQEVHAASVKQESCVGQKQPTLHIPASPGKQPSLVLSPTLVGDPSSPGHKLVRQASQLVLLSLAQEVSVRQQASQRPPLRRHVSHVQLSIDRVNSSLGQNWPPRKQSSMGQLSFGGRAGESKVEMLLAGLKGALDITEGIRQAAPRQRCRGHWIGVYRRYQKHVAECSKAKPGKVQASQVPPSQAKGC
eukprot:gene18189-24628_t